jgi:predicted 3-demethylubiquinone-9 3-methyltransferase (glyoxalase superfamily)
MTNPIYPCLWFDNQAEEAAKFYTSIFKNSGIGTISRYGKEGFEFHHQPEGTVMVATFKLNGKKFMGLNGGPVFKINPSISFFVTCGSINETNELWGKLIDGGKALMAIDKYPWSERYGWLQDKFGLTWQLSVVTSAGTNHQLTPSLLFTGNQFGRAEEAINFYASVFDKSPAPMLMHYPKEDKKNAGKVMYSEFKLNQHDFIAMDGPGVHEYSFNEAVSFVVDCETQKEIDHYWDKLTADGGQESMCGWLKDKFGVSWQIVPAILGKLMSDPERSQRVMHAFLKMKKFDIKKLEEA